MKTVLFVAYDFQPCLNIGGSLRSTKFVDQLQSLGWRSIVLASDTIEARDQGELFDSVHRIKSLTPLSKPYQITPYGWAINTWWKARKIIQKNKVDLIYVSCPPFPQIFSAVLLKTKFNIPLVLDFRDNWSLDPYQEGSLFKKMVYRCFFPISERWAFKRIDRLIVNTPSSLSAYKKLFPDLADKMYLITNGYDERDFKEINIIKKKHDYMQLLYCGSFGICGRNARSILEALKKANDNGMNISLRLVGNQPSDVSIAVTELGLNDLVHFVGHVPHKKAIVNMFESDVLVLYQESPDTNLQTIAGKTFEYVRSGKAILAIAPKGDNQDLISRYAFQYVAVTEVGFEEIYQALKKMYKNWEDGLLEKEGLMKDEFSQKYERKVLAGYLAKLFDSVLNE